MWVLKPIWTYVNAKYVSRMPRNRSTISNVKVIHHPCNCKPFNKIGRLSLINIELNLFQGLESAVHWSDGYTMLIGLSLWTCWYFIFWWSLIRMPLGRDSCLPTPGWYGFAHTWVRYWPGRGLVYVCQLLLSLLWSAQENATRYLLTFSSNGVVPSK